MKFLVTSGQARDRGLIDDPSQSDCVGLDHRGFGGDHDVGRYARQLKMKVEFSGLSHDDIDVDQSKRCESR